MDKDYIFNNKSAKETRKAYLNAWLLKFIDVVIMFLSTLILMIFLYIDDTEVFVSVLPWVIFANILSVLCWLVGAIPIIIVNIELKKEDIVFKKIKIKTCCEEFNLDAHKSNKPLSDFSRLYPQNMRVRKMNIYFVDENGKKKKIRTIMSSKKWDEVDIHFIKKEEEIPVFYLKRSGVLLAFYDPQAKGQKNLYLKGLNAMI